MRKQIIYNHKKNPPTITFKYWVKNVEYAEFAPLCDYYYDKNSWAFQTNLKKPHYKIYGMIIRQRN